MVLLIMALMAGMTLPAIHSAFTEQALRRDSHQLALMVKTAMIQTAEQHRPYVMELDHQTMALHPLGTTAAQDDTFDINTPASTNTAPTTTDSAADASATASQNTTNSATPIDVNVTTNLDPGNKLMMPDPKKANAWIEMPDASEWVFHPGELCPAMLVRVQRGDAYIEYTFNALTGNVEQERNSIP